LSSKKKVIGGKKKFNGIQATRTTRYWNLLKHGTRPTERGCGGMRKKISEKKIV